MDAASKQLEQLDQEIADITAEAKEAKEAWLSASDPQQKADLKEIWQQLQVRVQAIDFRRSKLEDKLGTPGGNILARLDRLEDRATYPLISPTARDKIEAASCVLLDDNKPIGVAFFIAERVCLTCNHNLDDFEEGQQVTARQPSGGEQFSLTVSQHNTDLDYATLRSEQQHDFVTCYRGAPAKLGTVMRISRRGHHMVYECNSWPGDSGASLALYDGEVVGMHQDGVNSIKEIVERKHATTIVASKVYLFQVTRNTRHEINAGLCKVLAYLPAHLEWTMHTCPAATMHACLPCLSFSICVPEFPSLVPAIVCIALCSEKVDIPVLTRHRECAKPWRRGTSPNSYTNGRLEMPRSAGRCCKGTGGERHGLCGGGAAG
ncbi:hypothetical protein COCSUDRAFT_66844 [Coccomyxa subellipsoidea C-169]|uniref:Serine protease n=1 Tax=Coccomyxa subellipsoidea (strain C-169) TaxID=574566 RepID=I0YSJ1_COCSC|nr:hypothetical protein COCSUDRAFT_66844 [Coccomyxa subellipsoidea C-169]EIE21360.1 hypothetical protein COCSUDRAFT_66844 [Coccomyxa subellipsoidea C-169]|eukprot:XP_005645904.1 hypothetical protein COCSUDRAFT_66844 [Coccomyxa subellipsoidea C-169]